MYLIEFSFPYYIELQNITLFCDMKFTEYTLSFTYLLIIVNFNVIGMSQFDQFAQKEFLKINSMKWFSLKERRKAMMNRIESVCV